MKHRGPYWPIAKGGEANVLWATVAWSGAMLAQRLWRHPLTQAIAGLTTAAWLLTLYFFRDPERSVIPEEGLVLCPADGEIVAISTEMENNYLHQEVVRISIFLSIFDVHVQRVPIDGLITRIDYRPGKYLQAFRPEASEVNESVAMCISHPTYGWIVVKQIAGIMARRCVNHHKVGEKVKAGDRFGMIRFGSRVDLLLPATAVVQIQLGEKVFAGMTPMARLIPLEA